MDFANWTDGVVHDEFAETASVFGSLALIAHLSGDFVFARGCGDLACFPNGMSERFLAINVLAEFDGGHRNERVKMIGRRDHDGVDVFLFLQHFAEIGVDFGFGIFFESVGRMRGIYVAQSDNVFAAELFEIDTALAADADAGDVELFAGWDFSIKAENVAWNDHECR